MGNFLAELKRRHIYRVAAAYAVVAWVLIQLVGNVTPMLRLPEWAGSLVLVLLLVGFPVVLIFAWVHQLQPATADGPLGRATSGGHDWLLIGALAAVIAIFAYQQFAPDSATRPASVQASTVTAARDAATNPRGAILLAVLPFVNLSSDKEQEFFSDGMTEEITSALAKVKGLNVVARTSAFQFKGENKDLRAIGQALSATHLIEGSVRKEGNEVRITAQLIKADDGTHLWTESYDRELKGVFAVQEEIATAIAASLEVPLGLKKGEALVPNRTSDETVYENYLRAKALVRSRSTDGFVQLTKAAKLLEQAVAREPDYGPAWALLALAYVLTPGYNSAYASGEKEQMRVFAETVIPKADIAARRAIELDPKSADAHVALASVQAGRAQLASADELFRQALALDAGNADALHLYSGMLADAGFIKRAIPMRARLQALEPLVPVFQMSQARVLFASGDTDSALAALQLPNLAFQYAILYAAQGRFTQAADTLLKGPNLFLSERVEVAAKLLRAAPSPAASPQSLPRLGLLEFAYLYAGASTRVLDFYDDMLETGWRHPTLTIMLWAPSYASVRKTDRFKDFVQKAGYVDYWRAKGWPEFCHPLGTDDFACE